ncbi:dephospho-CoA kinase [Undibacterium sp. LX15W]|uniref:Dephospho-CoA kinase n=2 Tax=Undibacterium flavidum TaxID=2762297 RepID=A0ABR6Y9I6_9BURK|nr:dephospho-CoA kinase [Undibacterium flavidum]
MPISPSGRIADKTLSIGLTGGIGSGKTTVANLLAALGASVIDTDLIAHSLTAPGGAAIPAIRHAFGAEFINADGSMDRQKMRTHVFTDQTAKQLLESILHPQIRQACEDAAQTAQGKYIVFVVPLLIESGTWLQRINRVLVIDCDEETQITRVMQRNQFSREQVCSIMRAQVTREIRLQHADDVINSAQELAQVKQQVELLHQKYLQMCAQA